MLSSRVLEKGDAVVLKAFAAAVVVAALLAGTSAGARVYTEPPKVHHMVALVRAGGGASNFKTTTLLGVLAGPSANAEVAKLVKLYGAATVKQFIITFDFVVADALTLAKKNGVALPATPMPSPQDGKALSAALYMDGIDESTGAYSVEVMLDRLVSHSLRVQMMKDIDAKYGVAARAAYRIALLQVMMDVHMLYGMSLKNKSHAESAWPVIS